MKHFKQCLLCITLCLALCGCDSTAISSDNTPIWVSSGSQSSEDASSPEESTESEEPDDGPFRVEISADNELLSTSRRFKVDAENETVSINIGYDNYVDIKTLHNCFVDVDVPDGEYRFEGAVNVDGSLDLTESNSLVVTDAEGVTKTYLIEVTRTVCDLPIVNIYLTNGMSADYIGRDVYSDMTMYIDDSGTDDFEGTGFLSGGIHGRGHSTWLWSKKPYRIKLSEKQSLMGLPSNKDWILLANYSDKSLIRNIVAYDMGRELNTFVWTPTQYSVDLFVNDEYMGVYAFGEQREIAKQKINLYESPTDPDRGYLIEVGGADDKTLVDEIDFFTTDSGCARRCTFVDPKPENMTDEQRKFIIDYVNAADSAIVNLENYEEYIDVDSFVDWIIMQELTCNLDSCFRRSCYFTKDRGGKLKMGPIWDFDLAFGNFSLDDPSYSTWNTIGTDALSTGVGVTSGESTVSESSVVERMGAANTDNDSSGVESSEVESSGIDSSGGESLGGESSGDESSGGESTVTGGTALPDIATEGPYIGVNWCNYLMSDPAFRARLKSRWLEVKDTLLSTAYESIDRNAALLQRSQAENYARWQTMGYRSGYQSWATANLYTFDMQIDYLKSFLERRAAWIDANIDLIKPLERGNTEQGAPEGNGESL